MPAAQHATSVGIIPTLYRKIAIAAPTERRRAQGSTLKVGWKETKESLAGDSPREVPQLTVTPIKYTAQCRESTQVSHYHPENSPNGSFPRLGGLHNDSWSIIVTGGEMAD